MIATVTVRTVAALCVARKTEYKDLSAVECFDIDRDVRTFAGGMPVVAHPPCRSWSAYCAHQAKPLPGEKDLGPFCVDWLRKCGGVLEHPAHSRLFAHCGLAVKTIQDLEAGDEGRPKRAMPVRQRQEIQALPPRSAGGVNERGENHGQTDPRGARRTDPAV